VHGRAGLLITRHLFKIFALATFVVALSSCAEEEQNRVLSYDKGTYLGKQDQSLSSDQLRELMMRSHIQRVY
jgi:hypothetical protein